MIERISLHIRDFNNGVFQAGCRFSNYAATAFTIFSRSGLSTAVEFCYRLNRRLWEGQIPSRLLKLCVTHKPVPLKSVTCFHRSDKLLISGVLSVF